MRVVLAALVTVTLARIAAADEPATTAADVHGAPRPGDETGRVDHPRDDSALRRLGRAVLWIPRIPLELIAQPVRGLLYAEDRYEISSHLHAWFTSDDGRVAIFPTAFYETGATIDIGARAYLRDLVDGERVRLRAGYGGVDRWIAEVDLRRAFGRVTPSLELRTSERDDQDFYGTGNAGALDGQYTIGLRRALVRVRVDLPDHLVVIASGAFTSKSFTGDAAMRAPGIFADTDYVHGELLAAWDTRRRASRWDPYGVRSGGGLALGFADYQHGLAGEPGLARFGLDLQRFVRIIGPRVLALRAYAEVVAGPDEVPFAELPVLGGASLLRGYPTGRFRDRVATVTQASYRWSAASWLAPSVFVDAGRVHAGLSDLSLSDLRVGYGAALELYGRSGLALRGEVATSRDGSVYAYLAVQPVFDIRGERF